MSMLSNPTVMNYRPATGENPELRWQVRCHHSTLGEVGLCYVGRDDATAAAKYIETFGTAPPQPTERQRRSELETLAGFPCFKQNDCGVVSDAEGGL